VDNSPRGFYDFADHAVHRRGNVVDVNCYMPFKVDFGDGLSVEMTGGYPISGDVRMVVASPIPVKVALRIPGWCDAMAVDGKRVAGVDGRAVFEVAERRTFELRFNMPVRIVHRPDAGGPALPPGHENDGKGHDGSLFLFELPGRHPEMRGVGLRGMAAYLMRGPIILAKSSRLGLAETEVFSKDTVNGDSAWIAVADECDAHGFWGTWRLTLRKGGEVREFRVCDFASAAPSDDWHSAFSVWF
jgi:hypothetical protein